MNRDEEDPIRDRSHYEQTVLDPLFRKWFQNARLLNQIPPGLSEETMGLTWEWDSLGTVVD